MLFLGVPFLHLTLGHTTGQSLLYKICSEELMNDFEVPIIYLLLGLSILFGFRAWFEMDTGNTDRLMALSTTCACLFFGFLFSYVIYYFPLVPQI